MDLQVRAIRVLHKRQNRIQYPYQQRVLFLLHLPLCIPRRYKAKYWKWESGTLVEELLDVVGGSFWGVWRQFSIGIVLHVGIPRTWLCSRDSFILGSAVLVVMSSIFPIERCAFSSFWLMIFNIIWTITFLSYPPSFSVSVFLSHRHTTVSTLCQFSLE